METTKVFKTKICTRCAQTETQTQSERQPAASSSSSSSSIGISRRQTHSSDSSSRGSQLLLIAMTLIACMPLPEARHVHTAEEYSVETALPTWQANPYLGLGDSSSYEDSSSSSSHIHSALIEDSSSSSGSSSKSAALEDLLYDEIAIAAEALRKLHQRRSLLRRRRRQLSDIFKHSESETTPAWVNPCNGGFVSTDQTVHSLRQSLYKLRSYTRNEYKTVRAYRDPVIDISDIRNWNLYRDDYKFLPTIRKTSNVCLQRWYGDIQTYVGSFEELGRAQYKADKQEQNESNSHELLILLQSARSLLCEIEIGINMSYSLNNRVDKLHVPTREEMRARLNFKTNFANGDAPAALDLKFAKHHYFLYMSHMFSVMKKHSKNMNIMDCASPSSSSSSSSASSAMAALLGSSSESNASELKSMGASSTSTSVEHKVNKIRRRKKNNARQN